jgi:hypothetical protein
MPKSERNGTPGRFELLCPEHVTTFGRFSESFVSCLFLIPFDLDKIKTRRVIRYLRKLTGKVRISIIVIMAKHLIRAHVYGNQIRISLPSRLIKTMKWTGGKWFLMEKLNDNEVKIWKFLGKGDLD